MSLITTIRKELEPLAPMGRHYDTHTYGHVMALTASPDKKYLSQFEWGVRLGQMDEIVGKHFNPVGRESEYYERFAALFTKRILRWDDGQVVRDRNGRIARGSGLPTYISELIDRLSYNPGNTQDVQAGKYIALLIGLREITPMITTSSHPSDAIKADELTSVIRQKLQEFPFYRGEDGTNATRDGSGQGAKRYTPPLKTALFPPRKQIQSGV